MRLAFEVDTEKNSEVMEDISLAKKKSASRLVANGTFVQGLSLSNLHFLFDGVRNPKIEEGIVKKSSSKCSLVGRRSCRKRANFNGVWKKSCSRPMGRYRTWRWAETAGWHWVTLLLRVLCVLSIQVKQAQQAQQFQQSKLSEDAKVAEVTQDLRSENAELHKRLEVLLYVVLKEA